MKNIKVLISAPADQTKEVDIVLSSIADFNDLMAKRNIVFTPVHWQKNVSTGRGERAQDVINDQISDCDMIVAIVGTRMGTATGKAESGTAEEVFGFCKKENFDTVSYNTHVFFNTFYDGDVLALEPEQLAKVKKFKSEVGDLGILYSPFSNLTTLKKLVTKALDAFYFQSKQTQLISLKETEREELGLDDYIENTIDDFQNVTSLITDMGESMTVFSEETGQAKSTQSEDLYMKIGIDAINKLADKITDKSKGSQDYLDSAYSNVNSALKIAIEDFLNDKNIDALADLVSSLWELIKSTKEGQIGIQSLEDAIVALPRRNKELIKAKKRVLIPVAGLNTALSDFNNNMELIVTEVERAVVDFKS